MKAGGCLDEPRSGTLRQQRSLDDLKRFERRSLQDHLYDPSRSGFHNRSDIVFNVIPAPFPHMPYGSHHVEFIRSGIHQLFGLTGLGRRGGGAKRKRDDCCYAHLGVTQPFLTERHPRAVHTDSGELVLQGLLA